MNEAFLHYVWQTGQFDHFDLTTDTGLQLTVLKKGSSHHDGGPDFINALIKIDLETWAGQVEIHINSSDWFKHNHHLDSTYDNTILHVVMTNDAEVRRRNGTVIPCLELKSRISPTLITEYERLIHNTEKIPCHNSIPFVSPTTSLIAVEGNAIARLKDKSVDIFAKLELSQNDWQEILYQMITSAFGMRVNKIPFELLAKHLPLSLLSKYQDKQNYLEALVYGTAGFLHGNHSDVYADTLNAQYQFLATKHDIVSIPLETWKFLRLRPANFPTIRLAQLTSLVHKHSSLFAAIKDNMDYQSLFEFFEVDVPPYWERHYKFGSVSNQKLKPIGKDLLHNIIINAVAPVMFCYGLKHNNTKLQDQCLALLETLPAEINSITKYFKSRGVQITNSMQSQGILQLHNKFCIFKNCLNCQIGHQILKQD